MLYRSSGSGSVEGEMNLRTTVENHKRKVPNKKPTLSGSYEASNCISAWGVPGLSQRQQKKTPNSEIMIRSRPIYIRRQPDLMVEYAHRLFRA